MNRRHGLWLLLLTGGLTIASAAFAGLGDVWSAVINTDAGKIKELAASNHAVAMIVCFLSGILTSLTPCVYPMIPITLNIFGRAARRDAPPESAHAFDKHTFVLSAIYVAGMCVTYSALGVVAGMTGSLFGKTLQSPWVLGGLALLFAGLALGQLGVFKLALPASLQTRISQYGSHDHPWGIFIMGIVSGLIVSPCVGPVIAGILAFVFDSSNAFLGFLYFGSFALGLGVLFLVIGGFSGLIAKLPRSGAWMTRVNRVLAVLMLVASGYYGTLLAKQLGFGRTQTPIAKGGADGALSGIMWFDLESQALAEAKMKNLPVLIDFSAEWCEACHEIERDVFSTSAFKDKVKEFIALRIDVTAQTPANDAILSRYHVNSLPTIAFIGRDGQVLDTPRINGNLPTQVFLDAMDKVLSTR